jgi:hypothetical protein
MSMDRDRWRDIGKTAIVTPLTLATVVAIFIIAYHYFDGWMRLAAIAGQIAALVLLAYFLRWGRYPGLFQAKTPLRLIGDYLGALLLCTGGLLVIAAIARLHAIEYIHKLENIGYRVGLEFEYKKWSLVQTSAIAPRQFRPGDVGRIVGFRVVARDDISADPLLPIGTVLYRLRFADSEIDVPETYVVGPPTEISRGLLAAH